MPGCGIGPCAEGSPGPADIQMVIESFRSVLEGRPPQVRPADLPAKQDHPLPVPGVLAYNSVTLSIIRIVRLPHFEQRSFRAISGIAVSSGQPLSGTTAS